MRYREPVSDSRSTSGLDTAYAALQHSPLSVRVRVHARSTERACLHLCVCLHARTRERERERGREREKESKQARSRLSAREREREKATQDERKIARHRGARERGREGDGPPSPETGMETEKETAKETEADTATDAATDTGADMYRDARSFSVGGREEEEERTRGDRQGKARAQARVTR